MNSAGSTVSAISREKDGRIYANSDYRKAGGVDGFWNIYDLNIII